jgi:hypothetical protein
MHEDIRCWCIFLFLFTDYGVFFLAHTENGFRVFRLGHSIVELFLPAGGYVCMCIKMGAFICFSFGTLMFLFNDARVEGDIPHPYSLTNVEQKYVFSFTCSVELLVFGSSDWDRKTIT